MAELRRDAAERDRGIGDDAEGAPSVDDLVKADRLLLERVDGQMARAYDLGRQHLVCGPGCASCCIGPFAINALEGWRLRRGLVALGEGDPEGRMAIEKRAEEARDLLRDGFPGDPDSGRLADDESELERFFDHHGDLPCPVLDPLSGRCELYAHRPVTCRSYGPPVRIGGDDLSPCHLCFEGVGESELGRFRVELDPEGLEETVLDALARGGGGDGRTLIAFALADTESAGGGRRRPGHGDDEGEAAKRGVKC